MTANERMTSHELRELADLDALGLLDEIDTRRFEEALKSATVTEQEQIRTRQATLLHRLVGEPVEELPEGLRERVLAAVHGEIQQQDEALAPIATIGRRRRERAARMLDPVESVSTATSVNPRELNRVRRAAFLWRAASFGLMAGVLAALFFSMQMRDWVKKTEELASQKSNNLELREAFGDNLDELTNPTGADHVIGLATTYNRRGSITAILQTAPTVNSVKLVVVGLKKGTYTISVKDTNEWVDSHTFTVREENTIVALDGLPEGAAQRLAVAEWKILDSNNILVAQTEARQVS